MELRDVSGPGQLTVDNDEVERAEPVADRLAVAGELAAADRERPGFGGREPWVVEPPGGSRCDREGKRRNCCDQGFRLFRNVSRLPSVPTRMSAPASLPIRPIATVWGAKASGYVGPAANPPEFRPYRT